MKIVLAGFPGRGSEFASDVMFLLAHFVFRLVLDPVGARSLVVNPQWRTS